MFNVLQEKNMESVLRIILILGAIFQLLTILYFNIFEADIHLGIDSSWDYLKAMVVGREGGYPIELLSDTTAPLIDRQFILAVPLYMLFKNINLSFAIANLIFTIVIIGLLYTIMKHKKYGMVEILIVINMFLCPYILSDFSWMNDLGYFSCVLGMGGMYSLRIIQMLIAYCVIESEELDKREWGLMIISSILSLFFGIGSGMSMIAMLFIPLIVSRIVLAMIKNDISSMINWKARYIYLCTGLVLLGRIVGGALGLAYRDSIENWVSADRIWDNLIRQIAGYMLLYNAIPEAGVQQTPMSFGGALHIFGLIMFVVALIAFIYSLITIIKAIKNGVDELFMTIIVVILTTVLEFVLLDTTYGEPTFERRYLLLVFVSGFLFVGYFIKNLDSKLLFKKCGLIVLVGAILLADISSALVYKRDTNENFMMKDMVNLVSNTDAGIVYSWGDETAIYERCMRVYDFDRVYKQIRSDNTLNTWGDYLYYNDSSEYTGATVLMIGEGTNYVPKDIMETYEYMETIHGVEFYYSKTNPINTNDI